MLRPWTRYPDTSNVEDWLALSRQLIRWKEFRKWQLSNRRQTVEFSEYLDEQRRDFERMGMPAKSTAKPDFVQIIRSQWEDEYGHRQQHPVSGDEAEAVLSRYAEVARELVMDCGFVQPFQLQATPKQQDQWTTYVEYLAFECYWLGRLARSAKRLRLKRDAEWEGLVKAGVVKPIDATNGLASTEVEDMRDQELERAARSARSSTATTSTTPTDMAATDTRQPRTRRGQKSPSHAHKCLQSPHSLIDDTARKNDLVDEYVHKTKKYQTAKAEVAHHQHRIEWVQSEISKIMTEQKAASKRSNSVGTISRKRKPTDDADPIQPAAKHGRTDETKEMVAGQSKNSRGTQSKKRTLPTDEDTLEPQLKAEESLAGQRDGPGTSRKRRKAIHEQDGSEAQSSVLEPSLGTTVVSTQVTSTATTESRPRRQPKRLSRGTPAVGSRDERLKTLRPRTGVDGLKTRGGDAARKAGGRPGSTDSMSKVM